jgi:hypothetical protein
VGSLIVAETFFGLLEADPSSFVGRNRNWKPTLPGAQPGQFTMADLLRFAGDVAPVDDPANLNP